MHICKINYTCEYNNDISGYIHNTIHFMQQSQPSILPGCNWLMLQTVHIISLSTHYEKTQHCSASASLKILDIGNIGTIQINCDSGILTT